MLQLAVVLFALLSSALAAEPFKGRVNNIPQPLGVSDAHPFVKRYCEGAPYSNTYCCGSLYYCFTGEVCCDSFYCCPGGTTCLGGLLCSPGGSFSETGNAVTSVPPVTTEAPIFTSFAATYYYTYYYTITWYYYTYYYTYDYVLFTTVLESSRRTTWQYFTITATDDSAASSSFEAISSTVSFSVPASETAPTPISIPSLSSPSSTSRAARASTTGSTTTRGGASFSNSPASSSSSSFPSFAAGGADRVFGGGAWMAGWRMAAGVVVALGLPGVLMIAL